MGKKKETIPADEHRCSKTNGKEWRCKNFRMGLGAAAADGSIPKSKRCEKHCNYQLLKNTRGDGEGAGSGPIEEQIRGSIQKRKEVKEEENDWYLDDTCNPDIEGGSANVGNKRKKEKLPPDEQYCCHTSGKGGYRCKNFRMSHGAANTKFCERHYNYYVNRYKNLKMRSRDREGAGAGCSTATGPVKTRVSKRRKNVTGEDETVEIQPATRDDTSNTIVDIASAKKKKKKLHPDEKYCYMTGGGGWRCKNFRMSYGAAAGDDSVPKTKYCEKHYNLREKFLQKKRGDGEGATAPVEIRSSKRMKKVKEENETGEIQPATSDDTSNTIIEGGDSAKIGTKRKTVEQTERSGDLKSLTKIREPVVELESLENYKNKCFELRVELEKQKVELEKKNAEFTILQDKYAELESRKTAAKANDAVEYWRNKCSDLETLVLKMETENSTMRCEVARVSNLESLVPRNGKENSILRCESMRNYEKIESEGRGLQNDTTESGKYHEPESEFPEHSAMSISSGSLQLASGGENDEEGRPFQHGLSSQDRSEMTKKTFVNLVSDSDDESEEPLDMLGTKNWNRNKREMRWKSEADMLFSFEADPVLCMRAFCALYRQEISEDEISPKGLVIDSDTLRCTTLAKFLMGEGKGDLKKSVAELEKFDSNAVSDCKKLVRRYSVYLFDIYENRKDPFFLPATTASRGDQAAK